jgi:dCMP deaminase
MTITAEHPTWDEYWVNQAYGAARKSLCARDQVGAVIVDRDNHIVSTGWNGPPRGFDHREQPCTAWCARAQNGVELDPGYTDCPSLHAEANALLMSDPLRRKEGTLYVTSHMCFTCSKSVANAQLARLVVSPRHEAGHRTPERGYALLRMIGMKVEIL